MRSRLSKLWQHDKKEGAVPGLGEWMQHHAGMTLTLSRPSAQTTHACL